MKETSWGGRSGGSGGEEGGDGAWRWEGGAPALCSGCGGVRWANPKRGDVPVEGSPRRAVLPLPAARCDPGPRSWSVGPPVTAAQLPARPGLPLPLAQPGSPRAKDFQEKRPCSRFQVLLVTGLKAFLSHIFHCFSLLVFLPPSKRTFWFLTVSFQLMQKQSFQFIILGSTF